MTSALTIRKDAYLCHLPRWFELQRGGALDAAHVAFSITGPDEAPVVAVLGGISATREVTGEHGWWRELVGPGRAIDTNAVRVLGIDFLGGPGSSTNASNAGLNSLPAITPHDQARALVAVCDELGIDRLHACVGASYGGQVGLALAAAEPDRVCALAVLCAADRSHPLATAWRSVQRNIVRFAAREGRPEQGLVLARALAMTTYRSGDEFAERFASVPVRGARGLEFPVESYLRARGEAFAETFSSSSFLTLSESLDLHRVEPGDVRVPTTLVGFDTDQLVPLSQLRQLRDDLGGPAELVEVETRYGHDGFLKEPAALAPILRRVVAQEVSR